MTSNEANTRRKNSNINLELTPLEVKALTRLLELYFRARMLSKLFNSEIKHHSVSALTRILNKLDESVK